MSEGMQVTPEPGCEGPDVFRRARAYPIRAAAEEVESALGCKVTWIERDHVSGSHAVFFVTTEDGLECVLRVATHPEHDLARERWAMERCRSLGAPVPEILACEAAPADGSPPYMLLRRVPGVPAHGAALTDAGRETVLEQFGHCLARIHTVALPGFGTLVPSGNSYTGSVTSLWEYVVDDVDDHLARLPEEVLSRAWREALRRRFVTERALLERPAGVLVHGDYRFKNAVLDGTRLRAIVDFEMVISGDPAIDLAWLLYSDGTGEQSLAAILRGYGRSDTLHPDDGLRKRLLLHQIRYALCHLWWEVSFRNERGIADVLDRLRGFEHVLDRM